MLQLQHLGRGGHSFHIENILTCYKLPSVKILIGHLYQGQLSFIKSF
jgi:hypothetical protein